MRAFMEEAIASSLLEGAATTRQEARKMIRAGRAPRTTGERMVMNNYQAILFIREHASTPMSPEFMLELQGMLTEKTLDHADQVGRFRTEQDAVRVEDAYGNILFQPPPAYVVRNGRGGSGSWTRSPRPAPATGLRARPGGRRPR